MVIGVLTLDLLLPGAMSLKDKRCVVKGLKDRLSHRHNISVAEVGSLDEHRRARLAVAMVSNEIPFVESCLSKIVDEVRITRDAVLDDYEIEIL